MLGLQLSRFLPCFTADPSPWEPSQFPLPLSSFSTKKPLSLHLNSESLVKGQWSGQQPVKVSMAFPSSRDSGFPRRGARSPCRLPGSAVLYLHPQGHPWVQPLQELRAHCVLSQYPSISSSRDCSWIPRSSTICPVYRQQAGKLVPGVPVSGVFWGLFSQPHTKRM